MPSSDPSGQQTLEWSTFGTFLSPKLFTLQFATVEKISYEITTNIVGGGKKAQQSGTLAVLSEDLGSIPSTCMAPHNHL